MPPTVPVSRPPSCERQVGLLRARLLARRVRACRVGQTLGGRQDRLDHRRAERTGWQRPARDLCAIRVCRVDTRAHSLQQPLADAPAREAVELDRQGVLDLVLVAPRGDTEPLSQERAHRALNEGDELIERDQLFASGRRQRLGQERWRLTSWCEECARSRQRRRRRSSTTRLRRARDRTPSARSCAGRRPAADA